jgi:hypothetical protein
MPGLSQVQAFVALSLDPVVNAESITSMAAYQDYEVR